MIAKKMTRLLIIFFILGLHFTALSIDYSAGAKIGISIASWHGDSVKAIDDDWGEDIKPRVGIIGGGTFDFNFGKVFSIQPGIMFSAKGRKFFDEGSYFDEWDSVTVTYEESFTFKMNYMEIPILLKVRIPINEKVRPYLFTGPVLNFLLGSKFEEKWKEEIAGEVDEGTFELDIKDDCETVDFCLAFGCGLAIKVGPGSIVTDFTYSHGFAKIVKKDFFMNDDEVLDIKNLAFLITTGYVFEF
jgi:hypothetical protein